MLIDFRQLFPKYGINPRGVLHIGANIGEEAPVYKELGIHRQVWFEANPEVYAKLKTNIADNPRAEAWNHCLGDEEGKEINFHISNNGSQSSSVLELGTHKEAHPEVHYTHDYRTHTTRLDTLFLKYPKVFEGLDFLNADVQGFELNVLKGMGEYLTQFKWAYLEVNKAELYKGCALVEDIDYYLGAYGFKRVETLWAGNTGWGDALFVKG